MTDTEKVYMNFSQDELDWHYNNRERVDNHVEIMTALAKRGNAYANSVRYHADMSFGDDADEVLDVYPATSGDPNAPVLMYFHGGYWFSRHKNDFQFIPSGFNAAGATVVVVNYGLIPKIDMVELIRQCQASVAWVFKNVSEYGGDPHKIFISGHSAGGHITAMMLATDWKQWDVDPLAIKGALAISGLYDLEPVRHTYMNPTLGFTADTVAKFSPVELKPTVTCDFLVTAGGAETDEFIRHVGLICEAWAGSDVKCTSDIVPDLNHFTVLSDFSSEGGTLNSHVRSLMGLA